MFEQTLAVALAALTLYLASFTFAAQQSTERYSPHLTPVLFRRVGLRPLVLLSLLVGLAFALLAGPKGATEQLLAAGVIAVALFGAAWYSYQTWSTVSTLHQVLPCWLGRAQPQDGVLEDLLFNALDRANGRVLRAALTLGESSAAWEVRMLSWLTDHQARLQDEWIVREVGEAISRVERPESLWARGKLLLSLLDDAVAAERYPQARLLLELITYLLKSSDRWANEQMNLLYGAGSRLWFDGEHEVPRAPRFPHTLEHLQTLFLARLHTLRRHALEAEDPSVLQEYAEALGTLVRDVPDPSLLSRLEDLVSALNGSPRWTYEVALPLLNGLEFARWHPHRHPEAYPYLDGAADRAEHLAGLVSTARRIFEQLPPISTRRRATSFGRRPVWTSRNGVCPPRRCPRPTILSDGAFVSSSGPGGPDTEGRSSST